MSAAPLGCGVLKTNFTEQENCGGTYVINDDIAVLQLASLTE